MESLEVVLKVTEACNGHCDYCYYFGTADRHVSEDKLLKVETAQTIANFLLTAQKDLGFKQLLILLHGGEPLLNRKKDFDHICQIFRNTLGNKKDLIFSMGLQSNLTLMDEEWINILSKHQISVSTSLDGTKIHHDLRRKNKLGEGTYDKVINGIKLVQKAIDEEKINYPIGVLGVINPIFSAKTIYHHHKNLGVRSMDFLLPDFNHDTFHQQKPEYYCDPIEYGEFLCDLFEIWVQDEDYVNNDMRIEFFIAIMAMLQGADSIYDTYGRRTTKKELLSIITIHADGTLAPNDELVTSDPACRKTNFSVDNISLKEFLNLPLLKSIASETHQIPQNCQDCVWKNICQGGSVVHRYSQKKRFDNPSIYCEGLKILYKKIASYMVKNGLPLEELESSLSKK